MSNERKPLLSDEWIQSHEFVRFLQREERVAMEVGMRTMRAQYEDLIDSGKLRVVEEVEYGLGPAMMMRCSGCGYLDARAKSRIGSFCSGCGNPIKR